MPELTPEQATASLEGAPDRIAADVAEAAELIAAEALSMTVAAWPVATGESQGAWSATVGGAAIIIENTAEHAPFVHGGAAAAAAEDIAEAASLRLLEAFTEAAQSALSLES